MVKYVNGTISVDSKGGLAWSWVWESAVFCEKIDCSTSWEERVEKIKLFLGRLQPPSLALFGNNRAIYFCDYPEDAKTLISLGNGRVAPGILVIRKWTLGLGAVRYEASFKSWWIRVCGLPFRFWLEEIFMAIGESCGGLKSFDFNTSTLLI